MWVATPCMRSSTSLSWGWQSLFLTPWLPAHGRRRGPRQQRMTQSFEGASLRKEAARTLHAPPAGSELQHLWRRVKREPRGAYWVMMHRSGGLVQAPMNWMMEGCRRRFMMLTSARKSCAQAQRCQEDQDQHWNQDHGQIQVA